MKVLVVGSGGREHILCWKLAQSQGVEKVFCAPGNAGIAADAECVDIAVTDLNSLADFAEKNQIGLTMVGPEVPLCEGIVDVFKQRKLRIFGPDKQAAQLEGSKIFAKDFMRKYNIPTAGSEVFTEAAPAIAYVRKVFADGAKGLVVKADGLAAGKGVIVAATAEEAIQGVNQCFDGEFGAAGKRVLMEECLFGEEASIFALTDGTTIIPMASAQDHKRIGDGDSGPNTGGMGAYSPAPVVDDKVMAIFKNEILGNFLKGLQAEGLYYRGVVFVGLMVTEQGPKVLEFNVRFGDPETQAVLLRLENNLAEVLGKVADAKLNEVELRWTPGATVCVVMASGGYPGNYNKGFEISGFAEAEAAGTKVFHAGTAFKNGKIVNVGGRVLGVTAKGATIREAIDTVYKGVKKISWQDAYFRSDIGHRALKRGL